VLIGLDLLYDELVDNDLSSSLMDALEVPDIEEADS
jgi:circadian clock protein KaiB